MNVCGGVSDTTRFIYQLRYFGLSGASIAQVYFGGSSQSKGRSKQLDRRAMPGALRAVCGLKAPPEASREKTRHECSGW